MKPEGLTWDISHASWSGFDEDGFPIVQERGHGRGGGSAFELQHPYGFYSRPHDAGETRWCTLFVIEDGPTRYGFLGTDPRFIESIPKPSKGSNSRYVGFKEGDVWRMAFDHFEGDDGTKHFYLPMGDSAMSVTWGRDANAKPEMSFIMADGLAIVGYEGKWVLKSPDGGTFIEIGNGGIVLKGNVSLFGGMSAPGGVPLAKASELLALISAIKDSLAATTAVAIAPAPEASTLTTASDALAEVVALELAANASLPTKSTKGV